MDDFVILHSDKNILNIYKCQISEFLKTIKLEMHTQKSKVFQLHNGVNFLGFRVFYHYKLLKKSNIRVIRKRLQKFERLYTKGKISCEEIMESVEGWMAYARAGNTFKLRKSILERINSVCSL